MPCIKFNICALNGSAAFRECMMFCYHGIASMGYEATITDYLMPDAINIVFGSGPVPWSTMTAQANHIIIFNLEQVSPEVQWFDLVYFRQFLNAPVWDYNQRNIHALAQAGVPEISYVPLGYVPEMTATPQARAWLQQTPEPEVVQDIDVLFYGSMSGRRRETLDALKARGLNVMIGDTDHPCIGDYRDELIARAKVVVNIHYYETVGIFEIVRVSYLLANGKAVVSELSPHTDIEPDIKDAIVTGSRADLPELCWQLVHDDERRHTLERHGFDLFRQRTAEGILKPAIDHYLASTGLDQHPDLSLPRSRPPLPVERPALPDTLNIGAGPRWRYDACNVHPRADFAPDLVLDLNLPFPFDLTMTSWRYGQISIPPGYFKKIIAKNVLQTCANPIQLLTNCLHLLADEGMLEIEVPHDLAYGAWSEPDTRRSFNEQSMGKFLDHWWQFGWQTHRLSLINTRFIVINDVGFNALRTHNDDWETVLRIPRAIDALHFTLQKHALSETELKLLPQHRFLG